MRCLCLAVSHTQEKETVNTVARLTGLTRRAPRPSPRLCVPAPTAPRKLRTAPSQRPPPLHHPCHPADRGRRHTAQPSPQGATPPQRRLGGVAVGRHGRTGVAAVSLTHCCGWRTWLKESHLGNWRLYRFMQTVSCCCTGLSNMHFM